MQLESLFGSLNILPSTNITVNIIIHGKGKWGFERPRGLPEVVAHKGRKDSNLGKSKSKAWILHKYSL